MTEIEAVKMSLDMWIWLNKNPLRRKSDYPFYHNTYQIYNMTGQCPCCEYYNKNTILCTGCPLEGPGFRQCHDDYYDWNFSTLYGDAGLSRKSSGNIISILQKRYDELKVME